MSTIIIFALIIIVLIGAVYLIINIKPIDTDIAAELLSNGVKSAPDGNTGKHAVTLNSLSRLWINSPEIIPEKKPELPQPVPAVQPNSIDLLFEEQQPEKNNTEPPAEEPPADAPLQWLDVDALIAELAEKINITTGKRFEGVTFEAVAYIRTESVWNAVKKVAPTEKQEELSTEDKEFKRQLMRTVKIILEERGHIATHLLEPDYFQGRFLIYASNLEKPIPFWCIPFKGENFIHTEERKNGILPDITKVEKS